MQQTPIPQQQYINIQQQAEFYTPPTNLSGYKQPAEFYCQVCHANRYSVLEHKPGKGTYCCCVALCFSTIILSILPFYLSDCQNVTHICPACSTKIGTTRFISFTSPCCDDDYDQQKKY